jgi:hypothetical protein
VHGAETILFLVVLGTVVAAFAGRLRVPAPSLLVIAGLVVGLPPRFPPVHVPPDVIILVVVVVPPPLLYAARSMSQLATPGLVMVCGFCLMLGRTGAPGRDCSWWVSYLRAHRAASGT